MNDWVKCSDRMPSDDQRVIAYGYTQHTVLDKHTITDIVKRIPFVREAKYIAYGDGYFSVVYGAIVTHWMPLPEPPKEATP